MTGWGSASISRASISKHSGAEMSVGADGDAAADHGQLARQRGFFGYGLAGACDPRCVYVAHVLHRPYGVGRFDHELPALVFEERPVACPQNLDALQIAQHADDSLGLLFVRDLQRDLTHRSLAADVYRGNVPDQTVALGDRPGDPGQLPRAVRHLDAIRVIERQSKPPDVRLRPLPDSKAPSRIL
jgi:hypothetical protein